jgi:hypothetical protein
LLYLAAILGDRALRAVEATGALDGFYAALAHQPAKIGRGVAIWP